MNLLGLAPKLTQDDYRLVWSSWNHFLRFGKTSWYESISEPLPSRERILFLDRDKVIAGLKIRMKRHPKNLPGELSLLEKLEGKKYEPIRAGTKAVGN